MKIVDTYSEILLLGKHSGGKFDKAIRRNYIKEISDSLAEKLEKDSAGYDFDEQVAPVINMAFAKAEKSEQAHEAFVAVTNGLESRMAALFGVSLPVDIIFYIGLCNGAGWKKNGFDWYRKNNRARVVQHGAYARSSLP